MRTARPTGSGFPACAAAMDAVVSNTVRSPLLHLYVVQEWSTVAGGSRVARYSTLHEGRGADTGDGWAAATPAAVPSPTHGSRTAESMDTPSRGRMIFRSEARASTGGIRSHRREIAGSVKELDE